MNLSKENDLHICTAKGTPVSYNVVQPYSSVLSSNQKVLSSQVGGPLLPCACPCCAASTSVFIDGKPAIRANIDAFAGGLVMVGIPEIIIGK
ncbi:PAAR domain-containing protein [Flammeovirga pacifica]|uniref:Uncharacterized protein n=1 Tax=Flammeovirga pacifica TaxID=915059 RepID=A0A1S1YVC6_FLAPC|nr:hypothetical protein [Flammeovirga pacifica]OHX64967.1 hypothetical protein NH26_00690 [Flammeovirga pacifica]